MANFNTLIKRKQYIWLGLILAGGAAAVGGGLYLSDLNMSSDEEAPAQGEPAPDMTGVVDSSFNSKVEQHATTEMQATAADLNKRFDSLQGEVDLLSKARTADQIRIDKLSSDNEAMQNQLKALGVKPAVSGGEPAPTPPSPPPGPEGEPQPASYPPQTGAAVPPPTAFYPGNGMTPPPHCWPMRSAMPKTAFRSLPRRPTPPPANWKSCAISRASAKPGWSRARPRGPAAASASPPSPVPCACWPATVSTAFIAGRWPSVWRRVWPRWGCLSPSATCRPTAPGVRGR